MNKFKVGRNRVSVMMDESQVGIAKARDRHRNNGKVHGP
jgi:hypothetical protein